MSTVKISIEEDDGFLFVKIPYDEDAKQALKEKFRASWDPEEKHWIIDADDHTEREVEQELKLHFPQNFR